MEIYNFSDVIGIDNEVIFWFRATYDYTGNGNDDHKFDRDR